MFCTYITRIFPARFLQEDRCLLQIDIRLKTPDRSRRPTQLNRFSDYPASKAGFLFCFVFLDCCKAGTGSGSLFYFKEKSYPSFAMMFEIVHLNTGTKRDRVNPVKPGAQHRHLIFSARKPAVGTHGRQIRL